LWPSGLVTDRSEGGGPDAFKSDRNRRNGIDSRVTENLTVPGMLPRMENQYRRRNDFGTEVLKMETVRKKDYLDIRTNK
jgi:hypothetical protein